MTPRAGTGTKRQTNTPKSQKTTTTQTPTPQKRKTAPFSTGKSRKKQKTDSPTDSGISLGARQSSDGMSSEFNGSSILLGSDQIHGVSDPVFPENPQKKVMSKDAGSRGRPRSSAAKKADSFVAYGDSDDSTSTDFAEDKPRRNNRKKPKDDEDEAFIEYSDGDSEVEEFIIPKSEKDTFTFDYSAEKARRWSSAVNLPKGIWSEGERDLFSRLAMRGFEPLILKDWQLDFPTLPDSLFIENENETEPVIHALKSEFHAIKSLGGLFNLSGRVRDCRILQVRPEIVIKRAIRKFIRWALYDANLHSRPRIIPVYVIYTQQEGESVLQALGKVNRRLERLAKRYSGAADFADETNGNGAFNFNFSNQDHEQRTFPILYGFFLCGPIVVLLTVDSDPSSQKGWNAGGASKFVSQFDLSERGQDVWNSLAIAIMTMYIRTTMMKVKEEARYGLWRFPDDAPADVDEDL